MRIINATPDRTIQLGYEGEDRVTVLRFRYGADWLENGEGIFHIRVRRHGEHTAYNAQLVADDAENNCLLMTVTNVELSVKGSGEMQVVYSGADFVKKSPIYSYNVSRAVDEAVDPPAQDVYTEIIESLSGLGEDIGDIRTDIRLIEGNIGDLSALTTTAKTDLVSAINEVNEHGGSTVTVDSALSDTSENPVQNKTITGAIREVSSYARDLSGVIDGLGEDVEGLETALRTKADIQTVSALADEVNGLDGDVQGLQTTVQSKADTSTVTALSGTVSGLQTAVQSKADAQTVTALSGTVTGLQTSKADKSYVDTGLSEKASTQTVSDLADDVSDLQTRLAGKVGDVQIDGTSVVADGVAEIPIASSSNLGVSKCSPSLGINVRTDGYLNVVSANSTAIKNGNAMYLPVTTTGQHESVFYGLAKVAGHDEKNSTLPVGTYSEEAKTAIRTMLGLQEMYEWYKNQT